MSFLAPSEDSERTITEGRKETMRVISSINNLLQDLIPDRIGRYTDEFYPTATGDNFQKMGHKTILIESGHSKGDYQRQESRRATFIALVEGLRYIGARSEKQDHRRYFDIPNNEKKYLDVIIKECNVKEKQTDIGILYLERLKNGKIKFEPSVHKMENLSDFNADVLIDGKTLDFIDEKDVEKWVKNRINYI